MIDLLKQTPPEYWVALFVGGVIALRVLSGTRPDLTCIAGTIARVVVLLIWRLLQWISWLGGGRL